MAESGRTARPRRGRPPDPVRQQIRMRSYCEAGLALYELHGYEGVRLVDLARLAGLSKRSLYLDFTSKDDLMAQIAIEALEEFLQRMRTVRPRQAPGEPSGSAAADVVLGFLRARPGMARILGRELTPERLARVSPARIEALRVAEQRVLETLAAVLRRGGVPAELATARAPGMYACVLGFFALEGHPGLETDGAHAASLERQIGAAMEAFLARESAGTVPEPEGKP